MVAGTFSPAPVIIRYQVRSALLPLLFNPVLYIAPEPTRKGTQKVPCYRFFQQMGFLHSFLHHSNCTYPQLTGIKIKNSLTVFTKKN